MDAIAFVLMNVKLAKGRVVVEAIRGVKGLIASREITGPYDVMAVIEGEINLTIGRMQELGQYGVMRAVTYVARDSFGDKEALRGGAVVVACMLMEVEVGKVDSVFGALEERAKEEKAVMFGLKVFGLCDIILLFPEGAVQSLGYILNNLLAGVEGVRRTITCFVVE